MAPPDAVVVLGAAMAAPGVPGPALLRRINFGVSVFFARQAAHLLVSGGVVGPPPAEAVMMRHVALARGVCDAQIIVEDMARNTFENALFSGRVIRDFGWRDVVIVTDAWHMPRSLYVFRRLGLPVSGERVPRPAHISRRVWIKQYAIDSVRLVRSAVLFQRRTHEPLVARVWGDDAGARRSSRSEGKSKGCAAP